MKPEDKAAFTAGLTTGLVTGGIAAMLGTPAAMAIAIWGTYRITKGVYENTKYNSTPKQ
jgi:hypothetical protein